MRRLPDPGLYPRRHRKFLETAANGGIAPVKRHGLSAYDEWGCGCPTCRAAASAKTAARRGKP